MCSSHMHLTHLLVRRRLIARRLWIPTMTSSRKRVRYGGGLGNIGGGLGNIRGFWQMNMLMCIAFLRRLPNRNQVNAPHSHGRRHRSSLRRHHSRKLLTRHLEHRLRRCVHSPFSAHCCSTNATIVYFQVAMQPTGRKKRVPHLINKRS